MFKDKGFAASSMRDLAETVGIEAASLYNHIRSKNEMLESICFDVANRFTIFMDEIESISQGSIKKIETLLRFHNAAQTNPQSTSQNPHLTSHETNRDR